MPTYCIDESTLHECKRGYQYCIHEKGENYMLCGRYVPYSLKDLPIENWGHKSKDATSFDVEQYCKKCDQKARSLGIIK